MRTKAYNPSRVIEKRMEPFEETNDIPLRRAIVTDNDDPKRIGRVRIRIVSIHGIEGEPDAISNDELPWALPCFPSATYNSGFCILPEVNSTVWVLFEDGSLDKPVYIGGMFGTGTAVGRQVGNTSGGEYRSQRLYKSEVPDEFTPDNETKIVYKSPKGASLIVREQLGEESVELRDQLGDTLTMRAPITDDVSIANIENMPPETLIDDHTEVSLTTFNGSKVGIQSWPDRSVADLLIKGDVEENYLWAFADTGEQHVHIAAFNNIIDVTKDGIVIAQGSEESSIPVIEYHGGRFEITKEDIELNASVIRLNAGDVYIGGRRVE